MMNVYARKKITNTSYSKTF